MSTPQARSTLVYGGSWYDSPPYLRSAYHTFTNSDKRYFEIGLRITLRRIE